MRLTPWAASAATASIVLAAVAAGQAQEASARSVRLSVEGPFEPGLSAGQSRCGPDDIPDAGLRAFRRSDGKVVAFASQTESYPLVGANLNALKKTCRSAYHSLRDADPSHFDDQTWIAATWTDNGRDVMAIAHHEYHGELHPGHCQGTTPRQCRYGVLLHLISHDGGATFRKSTSKPLAAVAARQEFGQQHDTGFFQPSNIFEHEGWKYVFARTSGGGAQAPATCLMRAKDALDPNSWTIFDGQAFRPALFDPYTDDVDTHPTCAQISTLRGLVWSVVTLRSSGPLLALVSLIDPESKAAYLATATSTDALHWSTPLRVAGVELKWTMPCPAPPFLHYPSLIDAASDRRNFDNVSDSPRLFFTDIGINACKFSMDRRSVSAQTRIRTQ